MHQNNKIFFKLLFCLKCSLSIFFILIVIQESYGKDSQLREMVSSIEGLSNKEAEQLSQSLEQKFDFLLEKGSLEPDILNSIRNIVSAGIFEEASYDTIAEIAVKAYQVEINGAPSQYVEDLALIGFSSPLTQDQLEMSAKSIEKLIAEEIEPLIIEDLISYGIYNRWSGTTINAVSNGILKSVAEGLDIRKVALIFIIGVDQEIDTKDVNVIIDESIQFLKGIEEQPPEEFNRRELAYQYLQNALTYGVPRQIGEEIYITAIEEKWSADAIKAIFDGLVEGNKMGLTTEKLARALIISMAQGLGDLSPEKMVKSEIEYVKNSEKKKLDLISSDKKKYKHTMKPINQYQLSYLQPKKPDKKMVKPPITYYPSTTRKSINEQLMWQTIREFLGPPPTPYRWGGTSRSGIDCSGFTRALYEAQRIPLPRTSQKQVQVGIWVKDNQLKFGDLVFFSKYFHKNRITHVGLYIGNGNFVHSSSTKGVTISSLNQRYYRARRLTGGKRIVY